MHFDSTYLKNSTTKYTPKELDTHTERDLHTHARTNELQPQKMHQYCANFKISIADSIFCYNILTNKLYARSPLNRFHIIITSGSLMFNPVSAKCKLLSSDGICFNVPILTYISFIKRVKPKPIIIHSCLYNTTHSDFVISVFFSQIDYHTYTNSLPCITKNNFQPIFKIRLTDFISFNLSNQLSQTLSRGQEVGSLHSFCIYIRFMI